MQKREPERTRSRIDKGYVESIVGDADANNSNPNRDRASASIVYLNETMATTVHSEVSKRKSRKSESQIKKQSGLIDLVVSKQKNWRSIEEKDFHQWTLLYTLSCQPYSYWILPKDSLPVSSSRGILSECDTWSSREREQQCGLSNSGARIRETVEQGIQDVDMI